MHSGPAAGHLLSSLSQYEEQEQGGSTIERLPRIAPSIRDCERSTAHKISLENGSAARMFCLDLNNASECPLETKERFNLTRTAEEADYETECVWDEYNNDKTTTTQRSGITDA